MRASAYLEEAGQKIGLAGGDRLSDEIILIQKAKDLDSDAWAEIYKRHYPKIYTYLYYRLGNIHQAEDMAASVFLEALERIGAFNYRGISLLAWLYRVAHNMAVDHFRREARVTTKPLSELLAAEEIAVGETAGIAFDRIELKLALKSLTEEQRLVILLKFIGGLSNAEVSQVLNKPEGAIKSLQHRALASLRRIFRPEEENEGKP